MNEAKQITSMKSMLKRLAKSRLSKEEEKLLRSAEYSRKPAMYDKIFKLYSRIEKQYELPSINTVTDNSNQFDNVTYPGGIRFSDLKEHLIPIDKAQTTCPKFMYFNRNCIKNFSKAHDKERFDALIEQGKIHSVGSSKNDEGLKPLGMNNKCHVIVNGKHVFERPFSHELKVKGCVSRVLIYKLSPLLEKYQATRSNNKLRNRHARQAGPILYVASNYIKKGLHDHQTLKLNSANLVTERARCANTTLTS